MQVKVVRRDRQVQNVHDARESGCSRPPVNMYINRRVQDSKFTRNPVRTVTGPNPGATMFFHNLTTHVDHGGHPISTQPDVELWKLVTPPPPTDAGNSVTPSVSGPGHFPGNMVRSWAVVRGCELVRVCQGHHSMVTNTTVATVSPDR